MENLKAQYLHPDPLKKNNKVGCCPETLEHTVYMKIMWRIWNLFKKLFQLSYKGTTLALDTLYATVLPLSIQFTMLKGNFKSTKVLMKILWFPSSLVL